MLYFSIPEKGFKKETLNALTKDPNHLEFGRLQEGNLVLGNYVYSKPGNYFFRFPAKDFKVNEKNKIKINFGKINYEISLPELSDYINNKNIHGGNLHFKIGEQEDGEERVASNHGAFVARKKEKSLERLVNQLKKGSQSKEETAQRLLDFVTEKIEYNFSEAISSVETLKRPNEVLMTRKSDCSGKAILYASLLEQTEIDYRLIYFRNHIALAVKGNFEDENNLSFNLGKDTYSLAETTASGFKIGTSKLKTKIKIEDINFIQKPSEPSIYNAKTGKAAEFM